ncbi:MAG: 8-amino-7-oxononanoate synthase [Deltaproteobacteria bacterium]|nr:8-amino-7-oxononanoate synthase [Deltaproteobacteria bacterium]
MSGLDELARARLAHITERGHLRGLEPLSARRGAVAVLQSGEELVNFSSNDYLGLATDPRLAAALSRGAAQHGSGAGASRLVCGDFDAHHALERAIADLEGTEASLLFNSGYAANCGLIPALVGPGDLIASDALNHASLIDGCRLSRASVEVYAHGDLDVLGRILAQASRARRRLVLTDTVFSMDGDRAPLAGLAALCDKHGALLVVDEAHATGILGPRGAGLVAALGLGAHVDARMGTLSKAAGLVGAHVSGSRLLRDLLINQARTLIFSTALPPAISVAALEATRIITSPEGDALRTRLFDNVTTLAQGLQAIGVPARTDSPIFPVVTGSPESAVHAMLHLRRRGILAKAIRPPTVPEGTSRLRIAVSAAHTKDQLSALVDALRTI